MKETESLEVINSENHEVSKYRLGRQISKTTRVSWFSLRIVMHDASYRAYWYLPDLCSFFYSSITPIYYQIFEIRYIIYGTQLMQDLLLSYLTAVGIIDFEIYLEDTQKTKWIVVLVFIVRFQSRMEILFLTIPTVNYSIFIIRAQLW